MKLTITEAAKLYRKQRKTLYRHINAGRLSCTTRGDGHRVIDFSEMLRVYGEPPGQTGEGDTPVTHPAAPSDTLTRSLLAELVEINRRQADQLENLTAKVERLEAAMRALPAPQVNEVDTVDAPRERPERPPETRGADTDTNADPHGLRGLVDALRKT